jgi:outer membrane protein assembly factor BamB
MNNRWRLFFSSACRNSFPPALAHLAAVLSIVFVPIFLGGCHKTAVSPQKSGPVLKWQFKSSCSAVSHPALANDGTIYFSCNKGIYAISMDGKLIWQTPLNRPETPVLASDGTIYVALYPGLIFGYDSGGKMVWNPGDGLIGFRAPPALGPDTTLYYLNSVSDIFAFQPQRSNDMLWSRSTYRPNFLPKSPQLPGEASTWTISTEAAPVVARDQSLILPRQHWLQSLSSAGEDQWVLELTAGSLGQAAIAGDGTIYVGDNQSVLYAADPSGNKKWSFDAAGSVMGSPVIDTQDVVYFSSGGSLFALGPDGALQWKTPARGVSTAPALAADGTLYVGGDQALMAFNSDGSLKWSVRVISPTSAPSIGPDGTIYFACGYSWLCALQDSDSPLMNSAWPKQFHDPQNTSSVLTGL